MAKIETSANGREDREQGCKGTSKPELSCDAISAQAALDQAREAAEQSRIARQGTIVGFITLVAAIAAAAFAERAAAHTKTSNADTRSHLRSYIKVFSAEFTFKRAVPMADRDIQPIKMTILLQNNGPTRAVNVEITAQINWLGRAIGPVSGQYVQSDQIAEIIENTMARYLIEHPDLTLDIGALQRGEYHNELLDLRLSAKWRTVFGEEIETVDEFSGPVNQFINMPLMPHQRPDDAWASGVGNGMQRKGGPKEDAKRLSGNF